MARVEIKADYGNYPIKTKASIGGRCQVTIEEMIEWVEGFGSSYTDEDSVHETGMSKAIVKALRRLEKLERAGQAMRDSLYQVPEILKDAGYSATAGVVDAAAKARDAALGEKE